MVERRFTADRPNHLWLTDLSRWPAEDLVAVQSAINSRPRKVLAWRTPAEVLDEQLRSLQRAGVARVQAPKGGRRRPGKHLSLEQIEQLVAAVPAYCRPVIWVLALCGIRFSEMAALTVADVMVTPRGLALRVHRAAPQRAGSGAAVMGDTKTHRERLIPLPAGELTAYCADRLSNGDPTEWLFRTSRGRIWTNTNFRARTKLSKVLTELGLSDRNIHDLRHTAATRLLYAGADLKAVQSTLGHASATMTADLYSHVIDQAPWEAMAALDELQARESERDVFGSDLFGQGASEPGDPTLPRSPIQDLGLTSEATNLRVKWQEAAP